MLSRPRSSCSARNALVGMCTKASDGITWPKLAAMPYHVASNQAATLASTQSGWGRRLPSSLRCWW